MKQYSRFISILVIIIFNISSANSTEPNKEVDPGVMLHCYLWSFRAIEENLDEIATAGFNSIQVSPVQKIRTPFKTEITQSEPTGRWSLLYQPVSFTKIGNYKLGTEEEFKSLCDAAHKRNIMIIVDVVLNHVADTTSFGEDKSSELDQEFRDFSNKTYYHDQSIINNYNDRKQVTQGNIESPKDNLPDLNTQNSVIQAIHFRFLNKCIELGADGFRFDAAKHIETNRGEDREQSWAGNYWNILNKLKKRISPKKLYLVGEVLEEPNSIGDNSEAYIELFDITASNYSKTLRTAISERRFNEHFHYNSTNMKNSVSSNESDKANIPTERYLAYVENHDTYEHKEEPFLNDFDGMVLANVFLIARANLVPRVFDRRGTEKELWKSPIISTINRFHKKLSNESEFLRFPNFSESMRSLAIVERGEKAIAIVNIGYEDLNLNSKTNLLDGNYKNLVNPKQTLNVHNKRITGDIPARSAFISFQDN